MGNRIHSFTDDVLADFDAVGLAEEIKARRVSASEVTDAAIDRVMKVNPELNAVAFEAYDRARAYARDKRPTTDRPFAGVPSFVKDNNDVAGMPTQAGSAAFVAGRARRDFPSAHQFMSLGYSVLGKTRMPEFGLSASTEFADAPPTRNPWDTDFSTGASSGGSAALVAAGAIPIAHANDGGGSIRIPAAATGLVGLKTTRGRTVDQPGARALPINLVAEGVVSRSVRDTAHHLAAMEHYYSNKRLLPVGLITEPSKRRLRIGLTGQSPTGATTDPETIAAMNDTAALLEAMGHHVSQTALPSGQQFVDDFVLYWGFLASVLTFISRMHYRRTFDRDKLDPITVGLSTGWRSQLRRTPGAILRLRRLRSVYQDIFVHHDVVLSPTLSHPVPPIGFLDPNLDFDEVLGRLTAYVGFTPVNNICGGPAIALPTPLGQNGLPGSIQLSGPWGGEATLLELAYELESARPFPRITD